LKPRALIAEDEPVLRTGLKRLLASVWPELEVVATASDGLQATQLLDRYAPDVIFLDIQMPGCSGLDVARAASDRCHVVFVTGYDQYAVTAFEHGAVDYLMKPISAARLAIACKRVRERLAARPANLEALVAKLADAAAGSRGPYLRWINVESGPNVRLVTVEEICYFHADTKYTRLVTADRESLIRMTLKELLDVLDPAEFWQIHRSAIVNVNAIAEVSRDLRGYPRLHLKTRKEELQVSQPFAHLFRQM
jgi:DNA-binding LytR/AlgR family response regulator